MTLLDFWKLLSQISFLLVSAATVFLWVRDRTKTRLDVALVFGSFATAILGQYYQNLFHDNNPWLGYVFALAVLVQPYLLLRVVRYFRALPRWVLRVALASFLVASLLLAAATLTPPVSTPPPWLVTVLIFYLALAGGYGCFLFVRGAMIIPGVTGKRLLLASLGSGLLVLLFLSAWLLLLLGGEQLAEPARSLGGVFVQSLAIASAWCYFLGFSPPRGLVQSWQLRELLRFLKHAPVRPSTAVSAHRLSVSAVRVTGAAAAVVALWDHAQGGLKEMSAAGFSPRQWDWSREPLLAQVLHSKKPGAFELSSKTSGPQLAKWTKEVGARNLYVVPIESTLHRFGLLLVALRHAPLFGEDDLDLLRLFCEQCALQFDNAVLLEELEGANRDLQVQAAEQARQAVLLSAANKELESFSYSVSHDLRSPLRGIDGWSSALQEDYGDQLDATAKEYLARVRGEAARMGQLIDDLFQLSRVSRTELQWDETNLSERMVPLLARLREAWPRRSIEFVIEPGLRAFCDARLMDIVLTNLFDNACKYTSTQESPRIEFGRTVVEGVRAFFVRDNGVGFDMAYADKLFGVFQRLHPATEFPGTGIGLAIVKRVMERLGGRVWATGRVNEGATVYFTFKEAP